MVPEKRNIASLVLRKFFIAALALLFSPGLHSAPLYFEPVKKILPDGSVAELYVSGDEFFNWLHDSRGYPVGPGPDGYYYYMAGEGDKFILTGSRVNKTDPASIKGMRPVTVPGWVKTKRENWIKQMTDESARAGIKQLPRSKGLINNMVIYIKFSGEADFTVSRQSYDSKLNGPEGPSVFHYYREVSGNQLDVVSHHLQGGVDTNLCYTDLHTRNYYQPYNEITNPAGYRNDTERGTREHSLLSNAVNWVNINHSLPEGVNFDSDNDGRIDNICFIVRGSPDGWSELLWPHRWVLFYTSASIGGLDVWDYTLQLENVSVTTLSHEIFHVLGAPDLYHYNNSDVPVGPWDIMASGKGHPGAWMKYKYGKWIENIPEIKKSGTYTIKSLAGMDQCCYILRSPFRNDQFFVLEYRSYGGLYETNLPGSGLIITRINTAVRGNSDGPPDEVYVFRKNGSLYIKGEINSAAFSQISDRTEFTDNSNPFAFFSDGKNTAIRITGIKIIGSSMQFTVEMDKPVDPVITPVEDHTMNLSWKGIWSRNYMVAFSLTPELLKPVAGKNYNTGDTIGTTGQVIRNSKLMDIQHNNLLSDQEYFYTIWTVTEADPYTYSEPARLNARTGIYSVSALPYSEDFDDFTGSNLPRGWKSADPEGWNYNTNNSYSLPNSLRFTASDGPGTFLYTPGFKLVSSKTYMISMRLRNIDPATTESVTVRAGFSRAPSDMNLLTILNTGNFRYNDFVISKSVFRVPGNTDFYLGFRTAPGGKGVLIDDIRLEIVPDNTRVHVNPAEFYPNPSSGRITVPATELTTVSIYRTDGKKVYETTIEGMQELDLSSLGRGLFLIRFRTGANSASGRLIIF